MWLFKCGSNPNSVVPRFILPLLHLCFALLTSLALISIAHAQSVQSLQLVPSTISGGTGGTSTGIVTLSAPAPAGGIIIHLGSSNPELAASVPQVTVPEGQNRADFIVATNAQYRRYSGLAFTASISAATSSGGGGGASATLNVTAQARPTETVYAPPSSGEGPRCGAGERGLLFTGETGVLWDCERGTNAQCTFIQECPLGCETRPPNGRRSRDVCATSGAVPIALDSKRIVGGNPGAGTLQLSSAAPQGSVGALSSNSLVAAPPHAQNSVDMNFATGATRLPFDLFTAAVNRIQFAPLRGEVVTPQQTDGGIFYRSRSARSWVAVVPGSAPAARLLSLKLDSTTMPGGQVTFGKSCVDQLFPAPEVGSIALKISSSHPDVASVLPSPMNQGTDCQTFTVDTKAVASDTTVTISAQLGAQLLTFPLRLTAAAGARQVNSYFLDPNIVTGGASSRATLVLDGIAPSSGFLVSLSSDNATIVTLPSSVTVPAGSDRTSFSIGTRSVSADVVVNLQASPAAPGVSAQLHVRAAAGAPTLTSLAVNPASVTGGTTSTATVTLSAAAPSGGTVVNLASNSNAAIVPASVMVAAGATTAQFVVNTTSVTANTSATLSASLGGTGNDTVTQIATLTVTPGTQPPPSALAAPTLLSPAVDARFSVGQTVNFDWSDVTGAVTYMIQIDDTNTFAAPLILNQTGLTASRYSVSTLPESRPYWRVRAIDASGNPGAWSAVRQIRIDG